MENSYFRKLPPELRNNIYEMLIPEPTAPGARVHLTFKNLTLYDPRPQIAIMPAIDTTVGLGITDTCREIQQESLTILLADQCVDFVFLFPDIRQTRCAHGGSINERPERPVLERLVNMLFSLEKWLKTIPEETRARIRDFRLRVDFNVLLRVKCKWYKTFSYLTDRLLALLPQQDTLFLVIGEAVDPGRGADTHSGICWSCVPRTDGDVVGDYFEGYIFKVSLSVGPMSYWEMMDQGLHVWQVHVDAEDEGRPCPACPWFVRGIAHRRCSKRAQELAIALSAYVMDDEEWLYKCWY